MPEKILQQLLQAIKAANDLYHRLVLIVGPSGAGKTTILTKAAVSLQLPLKNVNQELSKELLELTGKQRSIRLPACLEEIIGKDQSVVLLDNIEILFDVNLHQNPLQLLKGFARNTCIVAAWNGNISADNLLYADPGHPEFRREKIKDILIVSLDKSDSSSDYN